MEALIDALHEHGYACVDVCATADSSSFWAENRDVSALADLLGYRFVTSAGHAYDVLDLSEDLVPAPFAKGGILEQSQLGRAWLQAHFRICFARNKTDERESYALCLSGLLGVLPLADKDYYYRARVEAGVAVCEFLRATPVHFALIDATVSAHGSGAGRAPARIETGCIISSRDPLLADFAGALKMGLDPYVSPLAAVVYRTNGLPKRYSINGNAGPYSGWNNVNRILTDSRGRREAIPTAQRLLAPWLQVLNPELFPLKHVLDAKLNQRVSQFFAEVDRDPAAHWLLALTNYATATFGDWVYAYRVMADKDAIRRVEVPLGINLDSYNESSYAAIRPELEQVETLLADSPASAEGLRWREVDSAILFEFQRELPVNFGNFVDRVDVSHTIQLMSDYIGGTVVPIERDVRGRILRQAERNVYLPQPNYLVLYQGKPIDVSKIEVCDYTDDMHRMCWKTIASENSSAVYDDGMVTFSRSERGTRVRIVGRQLFTMPSFWKFWDVSLAPSVRASLVTDAYKTFFERTCSNFEAVVEGREVFIGRAWHEPTAMHDSEPSPMETLDHAVLRFGDRFRALMEPGTGPRWHWMPGDQEAPVRIDEDGFRHFEAAREFTPARSSLADTPIAAAAQEIRDFFSGLTAAVGRDEAESAKRIQRPFS